MDGSDRVRAPLAHDELDGVTDNARTVAEALRAAAPALPKARPELSDFSVRAASDADYVAAAGSLADARKLFGQLNRDFIPLLGVGARLTSGWNVFECPMFEHAPWIQRPEVAANPFMGTKMLTCGDPSTWQPPAPSTTTDSAPGDIDHYTCSMHPPVKEQAPGKCPICGMALVPVTKARALQRERRGVGRDHRAGRARRGDRVVMLLYLTLAHARHDREGRLGSFGDLRDTIVEGAAKRLRPKLMTVATMTFGLVPVLWSTGTGADVMKRIAAPMVGGLATSFLLELLVYSAIFAVWNSRSLPLVRRAPAEVAARS